MHEDVAGIDEPENRSVSGFVVPVATSVPPSVLAEFAQPWPGAPKLPHGHAVVTNGERPSPAQKLWNKGGWYSKAPMSTIGAVPAPVSTVDGSSRRRGAPARSVVVPAGIEALLPASMPGEPSPAARGR